jgi:integrase/recombinase XerD
MSSLEKYLTKKYSKRGIYHYNRKIAQYLAYINSTGVTATQLDILNYLGYLRQSGIHAKTVNNHLYSIKIYYNYLQESGKRKDHPCKRLRLKDQINRSIELESLYTMKQMEQFLAEHETKQKLLQRRDEVTISLLIYQGLTNTELVNIEVEDVDLEEGIIRITSEKGKAKRTNKSRKLSLKPKQILWIDRYLTQDRSGLENRSKISTRKLLLTKYGKPILSGSIKRQINSGHEKFMKMGPLKMRQSVIYHKLKEGHNIRVVQEIAGHRSIMNTEAYRINKLEELKEGINKYHPLQ